MTLKRTVTIGMLLVLVLVTGMVPLCPCTCCGSKTVEPKAAATSSPSDAAATCCADVENSTTATSSSAAHRVEPVTNVSTCSCDATPPTRIAATISAEVHVISKHVIQYDVLVIGAEQSAGLHAIRVTPVQSPPSKASPFLSNCTFLC